MIGKLTGVLAEIEEEAVLLDISGVGYNIYCSKRLLAHAWQIGDVISFYIYSHIREDRHKLYGFLSKEERNFFTLLCKVPKVGVKHAMALLGCYDPQQLANIIFAQDIAALRIVPGIGTSLAKQIIFALYDKLPESFKQITKSAAKDSALAAMAAKALGAHKVSLDKTSLELLSGLINLGYSEENAMRVITQLREEEGEDFALMEIGDLLRLALRKCASGLLA